MSAPIWRNYLDLLTINSKDFDDDPIVYHKSTMERLSKGNYICSSLVTDDLVHIQKYHEEFIFPLKHHTYITEPCVQDIATCSSAGISEENDSTIVSLSSINITPINCDMLKQVKQGNIKGHRHMT